MSRNVTLLQLRTDIYAQADLAGHTTRHSSTLLNRFINQSIQRFRERLSSSGSDRYLVSVTKTLGVGATSPYPFYSLDLSSESPSVVRVYAIDLTVNGESKSLTHVPFQERTKWGSATRSSEPQAWANYQTAKVAIMPAPDTAYTAVVWYLPVLADLSGDSDTFDGVSGWEDYIVWDVACRLLVRDKYPQAYQLAQTQKTEAWADILRGATRVASAGGSVIGRDHMGERMSYAMQRGRLLPPR